MIIPKKSLGQNFLKDKNIINKIVKLTNVYNENIIEVGPGLGALTFEILKLKPKKLILIEKDKNLYELLKKKFNKQKNVIIINENILKYNFSKLNKYKIISNLPYNISSKFLVSSLCLNKNISEILCMIQKEMAIKYDYNTGKMNKYKFLNRHTSIYTRHFLVTPNVFFPKPKVYSEVVKFKIKKNKININKINFFLNNFFVNKRKKLNSNKIIKNLNLRKYSDVRYEDLNYEDILDIYQKFNFPIS